MRNEFFIGLLHTTKTKNHTTVTAKMTNDTVSSTKASKPVSTRSVQPSAKFDLNSMVTAESNFQVDKAITLRDPPDAACLVSVPSHKVVDLKMILPTTTDNGNIMSWPFDAKVKPCAAYLHYNGAEVLSGTQTHTLRMKKGFSNKFATSVQVKASASAGIFGAEVSMEVTTGFSYEQTISTEQEETWTTTVAPGKYVNYQSVLLYAYRVNPEMFPGVPGFPSIPDRIRSANPGIKFYDGKGSYAKYLYFFVPVYKNRPFTIPYHDDLVDDVAFDTLTDHLVNSAFSKWEF